MRETSMTRPGTVSPSRSRRARCPLRLLISVLVATNIQISQPLAAGLERAAGDNDHLFEAAKFVETFSSRAVAVLMDEALVRSRRDQEFRLMLYEGFDTYGGARFALGRGWRTASERQRAEFVALFREELMRMGKLLFEDYDDEVLEIRRARPFGKGKIIVEAKVSNPEARINRVEFLVRRTGETFQIMDVHLEGFSVLETYRSEFVGTLFRGGVERVLRTLRHRLEK